MMRITLTLAFLFPVLLLGQADYEFVGPEGSWINSMAKTSDGTIYVEAFPHLFRLRSGEAEWQRIPHYDSLPRVGGVSTVFEAFDQVLVTMSGCCAMYLSFDQGETWQPGPNINFSGDQEGKYNFIEWNDTIFVKVPNSAGSVRFSTDSARSWKDLRPIGDRIILDVGSSGVYVYSYEAGLSRVNISTGEESIIPVPDVIMRGFASDGDTLVAEFTKKGLTSSTYYRSFDAGMSWDSLTIPAKYGLTISGGRIWSIDENGIYSMPLDAVSSDMTWRMIATSDVKPNGSTPLLVDNDTIHVGSTLGYFRANPGQNQVKRISEGMIGFRIENLMVVGDSLIIGTPSDFFISGTHPVSTPPYSLKPRALPLGTRSELMIGDDISLFTTGFYARGIYRSTDNGLSWDTLRDGITSQFMYTGVYLIGDKLIARPRSSGDIDLLWSENRGETWDSVIFPDRSIYSVAGSSDTLFLSTNSSSGSKLSLFRTFDGGRSWDSTRGPQDYISRANLHYEGGSLYYDISRGGLFRSDDLGDTWRRLQPVADGSTDSLPAAILDLAIRGDTVVLAGDLDNQTLRPVLLLSIDRGLSWRNLPLPLTGAYALAFVDDYLYTGSVAHGTFRIRLNALSAPDNGNQRTESASLEQIGSNVLRVHITTPNDYLLELYTIEGRRSYSLFSGHFGRGEHRVDIPSGTPGQYLAVLTVGSEVLHSAMIFVE